jgi:hypothetical protein
MSDDDIKSQIINGRKPNPGWFAKGRSGNPKGRPKNKKDGSATDASFRDAFLKAMEAPMGLIENGKKIQIPVHEALIRAEIMAGAKGSSHALRNALERYERHRNERAKAIEKDRDFWCRYIENYKNLVKEYADDKETPASDFPHPEELLFLPNDFVKNWRGGPPFKAAEERTILSKLRDLMLLQAEKDGRSNGGISPPLRVAEYCAFCLNEMMPPRLRFSDGKWLVERSRNSTLKGRELLAKIRAAFEDLGGKGDPTNAVTPTMESILRPMGISMPAAAPPGRYSAIKT